MANRLVDTEALEQVAAALATYIREVQENIQRMKDAAIDCRDNMGSDEYSSAAVQKLQECTKELDATMEQAQELRIKILNKKQEIEDSGFSR